MEKPTSFVKENVKEKAAGGAPELLQSYEAGDIIFSKGDPGGDLLFIETGNVEIFVAQNEQNIALATMSAGEIIGVMTFLTHDPRLAGARATTPTRIKKIPSVQVQKFISTFPKWLVIVLKEFVGRINEMNRKYSETIIELKKSKELQITPLFLATQMAQSLGTVGAAILKGKTEEDLVTSVELTAKLELVLNQPKAVVDNLMTIFVVTGLIKFDSELEKRKRSYSVATLEKAAIFTQFVRESVQGVTKKIIKADLTKEEIRFLKAVCQYLCKKGKPVDKAASTSTADLTDNLEKETGFPFQAAFLEKPSRIGLLVVTNLDQSTISLTPATILRTLSCLEAMRKLNGEEEVIPLEDVRDAEVSRAS